jgi:hypothetical protein
MLPVDGNGMPVAVDGSGAPIDSSGNPIPAARGLPDGSIADPSGAPISGIKADPNTGQVSTADGTPIPGAVVSGPDKTFKSAQQNPIAGANIKDNKLVDYTGNPVNLKSLGFEDKAAQANSSGAPGPLAASANPPPNNSQAGSEAAVADRGSTRLASGKVAAIVIGCIAAALMLACCVFGAIRWKRRLEAEEYQVRNIFCKLVPVSRLS